MLTKRQIQILDYIKKFIKDKNYSPSFEEIRRHFRFVSKSTVHHHIETLKEKGYLNHARTIELSKDEKSSGLVEIPLLGAIAAGEPIEAIEDKETIKVPKSQLSKSGEHFALRVRGESMTDEGILDGDTVIIRKQPDAENGETVVALINGDEVTLKKIYREKDKFRLQPANPNVKPIFTKELTIQGKVVSVIRNFNELKERADLKIKINNIERKRTIQESIPGIILKQWLNTIQCIDCTNGLKSLPDNSIDLLLTDPPYGISRKLNCKGKRLGTTAKLDFEFGEWDILNKKWLEVALPKIKGWFISFCAKKDLGVYWKILEKNKFIAINALVWQKPDPLPLNAKTRFLNAWEVAVMGKKPGAIWNSKYEHNILKYQAPKGKNRIHPTQKPLELIKKLIVLTTKKGGLVVDPFIGSGTTAVACEELERKYIGFDISPEYCELAKVRLKKTQQSLL